MKKFKGVRNNSIYYVGTTEDIKALYKSIKRSETTDLIPMFCEQPKFNMNKNIYALCIDENQYFYIVSSDTMLRLIIEEDIKEVKK